MFQALIAVALQTLAGQADLPPRQDADDEIVVTAPSLREVQRIVGDLSAENGGRQLARWDQRICPGVAGMSSEQAQFIADRMAQTAFEVGLDVGAPGCRANVWVIYTPNAADIAAGIGADRDLMTNSGDYRDTRGRAAARDFVASARPVRWWHVSETRSTGGLSAAPGMASGIVSLYTPFDAGGGVQRGMEDRALNVYESGNLRSTTREDFSYVLIVVDSQQMQGVSVAALADYLSMVALAQVNPDADLSSVSSVLRLFEDGQSSAALTAWDVAYLRGLYGSQRNAINESRQTRQIARHIVSETQAESLR